MQEQRGLSQLRDRHKTSRVAAPHKSHISSVYQQKRLPEPTDKQKPAPIATGCSMEAASQADRQEDATESYVPANRSPVGSKRKRQSIAARQSRRTLRSAHKRMQDVLEYANDDHVHSTGKKRKKFSDLSPAAITEHKAQGKALTHIPAATPAPAPAEAKLTEAPTPAKSLLADADDTECIPDTPDDGSASKAVHAAMHSAAMPDALLPSTAADADAAAGAQISMPSVPLELRAAQASRQVAAASRRMVPESPDEEAPLRASSQPWAASQPQSCAPALLQQPSSVTAHAQEQQLSEEQPHSLHLSLDLLSSEAAGPQASAKPQPLSAPHGPQASTAVDTGIRHGPGLAAVTVALTGAAADAHAAHSSTAEPLTEACAKVADSRAAAILGVSAEQGEKSVGFQATSAAAGAMTRLEPVTEAAEASGTPAGKRAVHAGSNRASIGSPMNDSALVAALDSAERKIVQAPAVSAQQPEAQAQLQPETSAALPAQNPVPDLMHAASRRHQMMSSASSTAATATSGVAVTPLDTQMAAAVEQAFQVVDQPLLTAANAAAMAASSTVASPMPVRQIQFPSYRPALPQQSRVVGLATRASAGAVGTGHGVSDLPQLGTAALPLQPSTQQQQLQQPLHLQRHQGTAAAPFQQGKLTTTDRAATCVPAGTTAATAAAIRQQDAQSVQLPHGTAQVLMPPSLSSASAPSASMAVGPSLAQLPSQQQQQQQPQQQLPHPVGPRLQISWPQPVVCWPQDEHAAPSCAPPAIRQHQGPGLSVTAPDASATPAGSASLQGGGHAPPQQLAASADPAGSVPLQGPPLASARAVGVSGPPTRPAPLRGGTPGPTEGSVSLSGAVSASAQVAAGVQLDLGARLQGNVMPPNKRHRLSVATLAADLRFATKAQSAQAVHPQPPPLQTAQPQTTPAPPAFLRPHALNPPPPFSNHRPQANEQASVQLTSQGPAQAQAHPIATSNANKHWQQQQQQQQMPSAACLSAKPIVPSLQQMQKAPARELSAHPVVQQTHHSLALYHNASLPVYTGQPQPWAQATARPPAQPQPQLQAQPPHQLHQQPHHQLLPQQAVQPQAQLPEGHAAPCHEPFSTPAVSTVQQQGLAQGQQARGHLQSPQLQKAPPPPPPMFVPLPQAQQSQPQAAPPATFLSAAIIHPMTHGQSPLQPHDQSAAPAAVQAMPGQQATEDSPWLPAVRKRAVAEQSLNGLHAKSPAQALTGLRLREAQTIAAEAAREAPEASAVAAAEAAAQVLAPQPAQPTPAVPVEPAHKQLRSFLPMELCEAFKAAGLKHDLYDWQAQCLMQPGVLSGGNLVYCAPTSGGKSAVAEILMLRRLITTGRTAMLVMPFVTLCDEKAAHLERLLKPLEKEVKRNYGGKGSARVLEANTGVVVCTIEKANSLINRMSEERCLSSLSCVVVDELHMVGEGERGYLLELLLTKLRYAAVSPDPGSKPASAHEGLQIIGMSATMPNVSAVAKWLRAQLFQTDFRPVTLHKWLLVGNELMDTNGQVVDKIDCAPNWKTNDSTPCARLAQATLDHNHSVLIFCCSKQYCEKVAQQMAQLLTVPERRLVSTSSTAISQVGRAGLVEELRRIPGAPDPVLLETLPKGVAFHHAGLTSEERELVETAYRTGAISVLCATSTLAAGVNLPARRVIFRHHYQGIQTRDSVLRATEYRQMAGRAGRAGIDTQGEAILMANNSQLGKQLLELMQADAKPIESCLSDGSIGMSRAIMEAIASGSVVTVVDVLRFVQCTLLAATEDFQDSVAASTRKSLQWLCGNAFITWEGSSKSYSPLPLGKATSAGSLRPQQALIVQKDLARAQENYVLTTDMHLTYLITPVDLSAWDRRGPDWSAFYQMLQSLQKADRRVAELVGVNQAHLQKLVQSGPRRNVSEADLEKERICKRFFMALMLNDIIQEMPHDEVAKKYGVQRARVKDLQESAGKFALMVAAFCECLGWDYLDILISKFQSRVTAGTKPELVVLMDIPNVKAHRARLLYAAGLKTAEAVAGCTEATLMSILAKGNAKPGNEAAQKSLDRRAAHLILRGARDLIVSRAADLKAQVAQFQQVLGAQAGQAGHSPNSTQRMTPVSLPPLPSPLTSPAATPIVLPKEGVILVAGPGAMKQVQPLWQEQNQWAFSLDIAEGQANAHPSLQLPSLPGLQAEESEARTRKVCRVQGIAVCWSPGAVYYIPLNPAAAGVSKLIGSMLGCKRTPKITYNLKSQMLALLADHAPISMADPLVDVRIATWLVMPDSCEVTDSPNQVSMRKGDTARNLEGLLNLRAGKESVTSTLTVLRKVSGEMKPAQIEACRQAVMALALEAVLHPVLQTEGLMRPLSRVEMPLVRVLAGMEHTRMAINVHILEDQKSPLQRSLHEIEKLAKEQAGCDFSLSSAQDVSNVLFNVLKLPVPPNAKLLRGGKLSNGKLYSTGAEVLEQLKGDHPLPSMILEHRSRQKLLTGFLTDICSRVKRPYIGPSGAAAVGGKLDRIGGSFLQTASATGRLAMDEPNLQCAPKPKAFVVPTTQMAASPKDSHRIHNANVRAAFVAEPGYIMLSADYSQIELRLMAHFAQDEGLCSTLRDPSQDPFRRLAAQWLQAPEDQVAQEQRDFAKQLAYGLLYGKGPHALAVDLSCDVKTASKQQESFMRSIPSVDAWRKRVIEACKTHPSMCVETLAGRRRYLQHINSRNSASSAQAERQAVNTICQGSAADLVKLAMIQLHKQLQQQLPAEACRLLLQVHDELLFEIKSDMLQQACVLIKSCMENAVHLSIPFPVKLQSGRSWGELEPYYLQH